MLRPALLLIGIIFLAGQYFFGAVSDEVQFIFFLVGSIVVGIPHGAADLLVADKSSQGSTKPFSSLRFFQFYLSRLFLFGILIYLFPLIGILLFLIFSAYHFGETDLYIFNTRTIQGKILVISYGLVILSVILVPHIEEVSSLLQQSFPGFDTLSLINWIAKYQYVLLSSSLVFFFVAVFLYFLLNKNDERIPESFLVQFTILIFLLYNLPLLAGFTFYFIIWHSVLSLQNIFTYLNEDNQFSGKKIIQQIILYSVLAFVGIALIGSLGFIFLGQSAITINIFIALAVLTAPHMQIMHSMYADIRKKYRLQ